ncbi:hypothetical protein, variant 1 [Aphanomyces invadans]|uniref:Uncharacterized protein n=1 Tax=Aphanomyces invadans TaxID=157072 RepID=A0A024TJ86_9STRA|nr:hypothetical protein, variant 1 [Aphanomyces invadans]ETV94118.1 hypothetical protein, variant 1 [Aphanomyces invadans]|eukprot:XP_008877320.1 hypothetical protein, variant 1 [Aphanomyces invadans]
MDFPWRMDLRSHGIGNNLCAVCASTGVLAVAMGSFVDLYLLQDIERSSCHDLVGPIDDVHIPFATQVCLQTNGDPYMLDEIHDVVPTCVQFVDNTLLVATSTTESGATTAHLQGFRVFGGTSSVVVHHVFTQRWEREFTAITALEPMTSMGVYVLAQGPSTSSIDALTWTDRCVSVQRHPITSTHVGMTAMSFEHSQFLLAIAHSQGVAIHTIHDLRRTAAPIQCALIVASLALSMHRMAITALTWRTTVTSVRDLTLCAGVADGTTLVFRVALPSHALITPSPPSDLKGCLIHAYPAPMIPLAHPQRFLHVDAQLLVAVHDIRTCVLWPTDPWPSLEAAMALLTPTQRGRHSNENAPQLCCGMASVSSTVLPRWMIAQRYPAMSDDSERRDFNVVVYLTHQAVYLGLAYHRHGDDLPKPADADLPPVVEIAPSDDRKLMMDAMHPSRKDEPDTVHKRYALPDPLPTPRDVPREDPLVWTKQAYRHRVEHLHTRVDAMGQTIRSLRHSFHLFTEDVNAHMANLTVALQQVLARCDNDTVGSHTP